MKPFLELLVEAGDLMRALADFLLQVLVQVRQLSVLTLCELVKALVLLDHLVTRDGFPNRRQELLVVPRLGDEAVDGAPVDRLDGRTDLRVSGQHDPHDVRVDLPAVLEQLRALHARHALVRHDSREPVGRKKLQGFVRRCGDDGLDRFTAKQPGNRLQDAGFVVNEKDAGRIHGEPPDMSRG